MQKLTLAIAMALSFIFVMPSVSDAKPKNKRSTTMTLEMEKKKKLYQYRCNVYNKKKKYRKYRKWKRYCDRLKKIELALAQNAPKPEKKENQYRGFFQKFFSQSDNYNTDNNAAGFFAADRALMASLKKRNEVEAKPTRTLRKKRGRKTRQRTRIVLFEQNNDDDTPSPFRSIFEKNHVAIARKYEGMSARKHRRTLRTVMKIDPMRIPWCAAFANAVLKKAGHEGTGSLMARSFLSYGKKTWRPSKGDIVVFKRGRSRSSGHVGFYMGETIVHGVRYILVLGGNQRKAVSVAMYPKRKVLGYRRISNV
jgi:uncharacterized protein (TIGR02594 family)